MWTTRKNTSHASNAAHMHSLRLTLCPRWLLITVLITSALAKGTAATCRFCWPYRVELFLAALLATGYGYLLSLTDHGWWSLAVLVLVLALVAGPLIWWRRTRFWALGIFMRAHSRRLIRAGLVELRTANSSGRVPRIGWVRSTPVGESMTLTCRPGQSAELIDARAEELRAAARCRDVRVARDPNKSHKVRVDVVRRDPLGTVREVPWLDVGADALSIWDEVHWGTDEHGRPVRFPLVYRQFIAGGVMDSGKSGGLNLVVSHAAKCPDAHLLLIDSNRVQLAPWQDRALAFAGKSHDDAIDILRLIDDEIDRRQDLLLSLPGVEQKVTREIARNYGLPVWLLGIDELAYHTSVGGTSAQRTEFNTKCRDVVARSRAFGMVPMVATQRPTSDVVPTSLRDLFSTRIAYRCTTPTSSDVILGDNWSRRGFSATDIGVGDAGVNWFLEVGKAPVRTKTAWVNNTTIADLSVTTIRHRPDAVSAETLHIPAQRLPADDNTDASADEN